MKRMHIIFKNINSKRVSEDALNKSKGKGKGKGKRKKGKKGKRKKGKNGKKGKKGNKNKIYLKLFVFYDLARGMMTPKCGTSCFYLLLKLEIQLCKNRNQILEHTLR